MADESEAFLLLTTSRVDVAALSEAKVPQFEDEAASLSSVEPLDMIMAERPVRLALSRRTVGADLKSRIDRSIRSLRDQKDFTSLAGIYIAVFRSEFPAD